MQTQLKRYAITIKGKVQHIGYRGIIESIEKKQINEDLPLPNLFSRIATDEYYEFGRKFDIGLDYLDGIKTDTGDIRGTLGDMKGTLEEVSGGIGDVKNTLGDMKGTLNSIDKTLGTFVGEQREHNQRLEKILEKVSEK
ncbi:Uncharacterised protein [uncultured archaeon]|nr:Uncharacterised protein [uncultured archaeon]